MIPFIDFWQNNGIPVTWHPKSTRTTWFCTDTYENYKQTKNNLFLPESFDYNFNQWGYRIGERDWDINTKKKKVVAIGCSHTVGVGVPWENTWPVLFAKELGDVELFNLAVAGSSSDSVLRILYFSLDIIKPDVVTVFWPEAMRWEFYETQQWDCTGAECHIPKGMSVWNTDAELINESHLKNNRNKNVAMVRLLQRLYGFQLLELDAFGTIDECASRLPPGQDPTGQDSRDQVHPGLVAHQYVKNKYIDKYSEL